MILKTIIKILLLFAAINFVPFLIWISCNVDKIAPKMKFRQFVSLYSINPGKWDFFLDVPRYEVDGYMQDIRLGYFDWYRFLVWKALRDYKQAKNYNKKISERMIESWLNDIQEFRENP